MSTLPLVPRHAPAQATSSHESERTQPSTKHHRSLPPKIPQRSPTGSWPSLLAFISTFLAISAVSIHLRYALPEPAPLPDSDDASFLHFSESLANQYIHHFADTIGYRIVGTEEMTESVEYLLQVLDGLKKDAEKVENPKEFEIWHQQDDGAHLFEFIGKRVWKKYFQLSNVIVRLSDPTIPKSKENAILINAHIDSTLPSPGAADDVAGVAVMLEAIRIISQSPDWKMYNGVVFLFNGAEESLQDASHMFITKHPLKDVVRAVINLEACGTDGQEILFQATSREMIEAYAKVPRPFGTIVATEVFKTGLIASDTDFRQFVQYGNLTGLDMAIMQNSYFYHTSQDIPSKIERGAIQHMGDNTMALLKHLTSETSDLTNIKPAASTVFFSALGGLVFVMYSKTTALRLYIALSVVAATLAARNIKSQHYKIYIWAIVAVVGSLLSFAIAANLVAFITSVIFEKPLSWYKHECLPLLLFGPPSITGGLMVQYLFSKLARRSTAISADDGHVLPHATLCGLMSFNGIAAIIGAYFNVGTAYLPAFGLISMLAALLINDLILAPITGKRGHLHLPMYLAALILPGFIGVEGLLAFLDLFVPLTGRMGHDVHVDYIIASLVSTVGFNVVSIILPFAHRFDPRALGRFILLSSLFTSMMVVMFTRDKWAVFDEDHPKRLAILHMENITTSPPTFGLHIASMDRAPGFEGLVKNITGLMSLSHEEPVMNAINDDIPDWDVIFPVSQFLKSYQIPLKSAEHQLMVSESDKSVAQYVSPWKDLFKITSVSNKLDFVKQERTLSLAIDHPGIIWSVIAFTADVVAWDLPEAPLRGRRRHHIKEASAFGVDRWTLNLTIALTEAEFEEAMHNEQIVKGQRPPVSVKDRLGQLAQRRGQLRVDFSGLDQMGLYPARSLPKPQRAGRPENPQGWAGTGNGGPGMQFFRLMTKVLPSWVDPLHLSAVANVAYV